MKKSEMVESTGRDDTTHRAIEILEILHRLNGSARTTHLADAMGVSEETVRRTVKKLSKKGIVARVHGGVYLTGEVQEPSFFHRIGKRSREKRRIAKAAASLVGDGNSLFLDVGSTTNFVAAALASLSGIQVVTNSVNVAKSLMQQNGNRVHFAGGELQMDKCGTFGRETLSFIDRFFFDVAILSADAFDMEHGFLLQDPSEADVANAVISKTRKTVFVVDQTKFSLTAPMISGRPGNVDFLVTDADLPIPVSETLNRWGTEVIVASDDGRVGRVGTSLRTVG
ncbi:MAG: DeoR/GlpR family DNA-binding transcription regulator [Rhodobacteraceae bacterium]|nr:DeoR/GlpR family DNA-binding transcription regulator [Paracoccaceae bacterium]MCY4139499.1 DeoR/GlpR family DNA-binding transcription regulator [Paracoccaceae bacterium]